MKYHAGILLVRKGAMIFQAKDNPWLVFPKQRYHLLHVCSSYSHLYNLHHVYFVQLYHAGICFCKTPPIAWFLEKLNLLSNS